MYDSFESFVASVMEVFCTMVGICPERMDGFEKDLPGNNRIIGAMILKGEGTRLITIETDERSAGFILSNMTGALPEDLTQDELVDGIQELVNMVAGASKKKLELSGGGFMLTSTFAFKGNDARFFTKKGIGRQSACFKVEESYISLHLYHM